ncbi:MAG TPA: Uma2 family endonuclease [Bryobacteraceae bacterium]|jgi:Uma2 family endonuclease|nr:Uma2 family endonuclease [Bryobacteraceae bacterium]
MASHSVTKLTEEQYLALDRAAEFKSEYFDGEMFAMSGASMRHTDLQSNLHGELYAALRDKDCRVHGPDFRIRVSSRMYTYPDISVVCGKRLLADDSQDALLNPAVIIEVLSPSTESYDRGLKLQAYRTIASLQDYILINQNEIRIEQYTRLENNLWILRDYQSLDEELAISSIGVSLPLSRIYNRVEFPAT